MNIISINFLFSRQVLKQRFSGLLKIKVLEGWFAYGPKGDGSGATLDGARLQVYTKQ